MRFRAAWPADPPNRAGRLPEDDGKRLAAMMDPNQQLAQLLQQDRRYRLEARDQLFWRHIAPAQPQTAVLDIRLDIQREEVLAVGIADHRLVLAQQVQIGVHHPASWGSRSPGMWNITCTSRRFWLLCSCG